MKNAAQRALLALPLALAAAACRIELPGSFVSGSEVRLREEASREEVRALELAPGDVLELATSFGRIEVVGSSDDRSELRATLHANGRTREEAEAVLARYRLELERSSGGLRVELAGEALNVRMGASQLELSAHADFLATVPLGTPLVARSGSGDLVTRGALGVLRLETGYGNVSIEEARGGVRAESGSGDVTVERLVQGEAELSSSYGDVFVAEAEARRVACTSGSGDIRVDAARAERLELSTRYGAVHVRRAAGDIRAASDSGDVRLHDVRGAVEARSDYGLVEVDGILSALDAWSGSGSVRVHAREGSRVESGWELDSSYGNVVLEAPADLACVLDARTGYGKVACDFPVRIEGGKKGSEHVLKGTIGAGGGTLTLTSSSGDVVLRKL